MTSLRVPALEKKLLMFERMDSMNEININYILVWGKYIERFSSLARVRRRICGNTNQVASYI